ncbi:MAG: hypothetical protein EZS28_009082 [Streblomastix strix]|uniref:Uncharacterized protein n=1 Tax=Streblomastix strix TaxID=222440 RepID=A0A5J4WK09_9EUKA|nr:MAG: hypothetical protein EZS28_009082 [Streblomastix strix]
MLHLSNQVIYHDFYGFTFVSKVYSGGGPNICGCEIGSCGSSLVSVSLFDWLCRYPHGVLELEFGFDLESEFDSWITIIMKPKKATVITMIMTTANEIPSGPEMGFVSGGISSVISSGSTSKFIWTLYGPSFRKRERSSELY